MKTIRSAKPISRLGDDNRSRIWSIGIAAALIVALAIIVAVASDGESDELATAPLMLSLGDSEAAASCLPFSVEILASMPQAFAGTVTSVDRDAITMTVDRWYAGGDTSVVQLTTVANAQALVGGTAYELGSQYLISASDGAVAYCGYSGPVSPELQASFDTVFGG